MIEMHLLLVRHAPALVVPIVVTLLAPTPVMHWLVAIDIDKHLLSVDLLFRSHNTQAAIGHDALSDSVFHHFFERAIQEQD